MSYDKLQGRRAIAVIPADGVPVPSPSFSKKTSTNTSVVAGSLVDSAGDFIDLGVKHGDIVYNTTDGTAAVVLQRDSDTELILSADIFGLTGKSYTIYAGSGETGPVLYVGTGGNLTVITEGGDSVTLVNLPNAVFIPIQVQEVSATGTTCTDILALW